jgi:hypothetical protein
MAVTNQFTLQFHMITLLQKSTLRKLSPNVKKVCLSRDVYLVLLSLTVSRS